MKIAIIGLGYVGLPLCLQFARNGVVVIGLDIDVVKVDCINAGKSYIQHIDGEDVEKLVEEKTLSASTDFSKIREVEAVIIVSRRRSRKIASRIFPTSSDPARRSHPISEKELWWCSSQPRIRELRTKIRARYWNGIQV